MNLTYTCTSADKKGSLSQNEMTEELARTCNFDWTVGHIVSISVRNEGRIISVLTDTDERDAFFDARDRNRQWKAKPLLAVIKEEPIDSNLKTTAALGKPKLSDVPPIALFALGAAMSDGAKKYGRFNWRETGATSSVFYDAIQRHLLDWYNGEDHAHDSKIVHLGHVMAGCAILLDAEIHKKLNDDRDKRNSESLARHENLWKDVSLKLD